MTANDIKTGQELLAEDFIRANPAWTKVSGPLQLLVLLWERSEMARVPALRERYTPFHHLRRPAPLSLDVFTGARVDVQDAREGRDTVAVVL